MTTRLPHANEHSHPSHRIMQRSVPRCAPRTEDRVLLNSASWACMVLQSAVLQLDFSPLGRLNIPKVLMHKVGSLVRLSGGGYPHPLGGLGIPPSPSFPGKASQSLPAWSWGTSAAQETLKRVDLRSHGLLIARPGETFPTPPEFRYGIILKNAQQCLGIFNKPIF